MDRKERATKRRHPPQTAPSPSAFLPSTTFDSVQSGTPPLTLRTSFRQGCVRKQLQVPPAPVWCLCPGAPTTGHTLADSKGRTPPLWTWPGNRGGISMLQERKRKCSAAIQVGKHRQREDCFFFMYVIEGRKETSLGVRNLPLLTQFPPFLHFSFLPLFPHRTLGTRPSSHCASIASGFSLQTPPPYH